MMKRAAALLVLCLAAAPAAATGSVSCTAEDGTASIDLTLGSLPVLAVVNATIGAGSTIWSTTRQEAVPIVVGQAFQDGETMRIDFTDPNVERVLIEFRAFKASEGSDAATGGVLRIPDVGAWAVICDGP